MKSTIHTTLILLLTAAFIAGCASQPKPQGDTADDQRSRAKQTQDELNRDTSR